MFPVCPAVHRSPIGRAASGAGAICSVTHQNLLHFTLEKHALPRSRHNGNVLSSVFVNYSLLSRNRNIHTSALYISRQTWYNIHGKKIFAEVQP